MNYRVLQKAFEYENCPIVIRQSGEHFEYITCINNQIYSSFIVAHKSIVQRLLFRPYSEDQLKNITNYMLAMAQATINSVLKIKPTGQEATPSP